MPIVQRSLLYLFALLKGNFLNSTISTSSFNINLFVEYSKEGGGGWTLYRRVRIDNIHIFCFREIAKESFEFLTLCTRWLPRGHFSCFFGNLEETYLYMHLYSTLSSFLVSFVLYKIYTGNYWYFVYYCSYEKLEMGNQRYYMELKILFANFENGC